MKSLPLTLLSFVSAAIVGASPPLPDELKEVCVLVNSRVDGSFSSTIAGGTGFFVAPNLVLTCDHVTRPPTWRGDRAADEIEIETSRGRMVSAKVVVRDPDHDLALLQCAQRTSGRPLQLTSEPTARGTAIT